MGEADKQRMADLLRKNRRKKLIPVVVQKWATRGVTASPLSDERQQELLTDLRAWRHTEYRAITDLRSVVLEFLNHLTLVVIIDFDVNEEPALLIPAHSLAVSERDLRTVYPDGFALVREEAALTVDFEEELGRVNVSYAVAH
jgi:hypothetical protein